MFGFRLRADGPAGPAYRPDDEDAEPRRYRIGQQDTIRLSLAFDNVNYRSTLVALGYPYDVEPHAMHVTEQRRVNGKRGIQTDQIDLAAMCHLLVAGRGDPTGRREAAALLSL